MFNHKMLGFVAVSLSTVAISAHAATEGVYLGGQLGYGDVHQSFSSDVDSINIPGTLSISKSEDGLAGRLFAGYQFNPYVAAELGWTKFSDVTSKGDFSYYNAGYSATLKTDAIDLVAKASLPLNDTVSLYGKLGGAYVIERADGHEYYGRYSKQVSATEKALLPTMGVGVSYALNDNLATNLEYSRIQKTGDTDINSTDFVGLGLIYSIG